MRAPSAQEVARAERVRFLAEYEQPCGHAVFDLREEHGVLVCMMCDKPIVRRATKR